MSYVVHVTAVVEGDLEKIEILINDYRYKCLENQSGMDQFFVCRNAQVFKDKQAHKIHLEGNDPKWFFEQMEENSFDFQGQWVAGIEIESSEGQVLN
jgi:hypothetical protein